MTDTHRLAEQAWQYAHAGMAGELVALLTAYDYLNERLKAFGPAVLIGDYRLADGEEAGVEAEARDALGLIRDGLRLSAHLLAGAPEQLAGQLWARLADFEQPPIQSLLQDARAGKSEPWLRPHSACLQKPGGALIRTEPLSSGAQVYLHPDSRHYCILSLSRRLVSANPIREEVTADIEIRDIESGVLARRVALACGDDFIPASLVFFADGQRVLLSGGPQPGQPNAVRVCEIDSGRTLARVEEKGSRIWGEAVTATGERFITRAEDETLTVWDTASGAKISRITVDESVDRIDPLPDGERLVTAGREEIALWNMKKGKKLKSIKNDEEGRRDITWNQQMMYLGRGAYLTFTDENAFIVRQVDTGAVRFSSDNPGQVKIFDKALLTGRYLISGSAVLDCEARKPKTFFHKEYLTTLAASEDERYLMTGDLHEVRFWRLAGQEEELKNAGYGPSFLLAGDGARAVLDAPMTRGVMNRNGRELVWADTAGEVMKRLGGLDHVNDLFWLADENYLLALNGWMIELYDIGRGRMLSTKMEYESPQRHFRQELLASSPDGSRLFSAIYEASTFTSAPGVIAMLETASGRCLHVFPMEHITCDMSVTPDGRQLVVSEVEITDQVVTGAGRIERHYLTVWDLESKERISRVKTSDNQSRKKIRTLLPGRRALLENQAQRLEIWSLDTPAQSYSAAYPDDARAGRPAAPVTLAEGAYVGAAVRTLGRNEIEIFAADYLAGGDICPLARFSGDPFERAVCSRKGEEVVVAASSTSGHVFFFTLENVVRPGTEGIDLHPPLTGLPAQPVQGVANTWDPQTGTVKSEEAPAYKEVAPSRPMPPYRPVAPTRQVAPTRPMPPPRPVSGGPARPKGKKGLLGGLFGRGKK